MQLTNSACGGSDKNRETTSVAHPTPSLTVAVCTRGRPERLRTTLAALEREAAAGFDMVVVDQSDEPAPGRRARLIADPGHGLSRARNVALRETQSEWIAFVDDDCTVAHGFGRALLDELSAHPDADWVSGHVGAGGRAEGGDLPLVTTFCVERDQVRSGRWTLPGSIGFGVLFAVRRTTAERLGGWDERFGPGVAAFPAADDMDFNYRLLRSGGVAVLSTRVRAVHEQWRSPGELAVLQRGYLRAWSGFAAKHLRSGDLRGGVWLWSWGVVDVVHMAKSALLRRSRLRAGLAWAKLRGLAEGSVAGLRRRW